MASLMTGSSHGDSYSASDISVLPIVKFTIDFMGEMRSLGFNIFYR